jgi:hypothetical protein
MPSLPIHALQHNAAVGAISRVLDLDSWHEKEKASSQTRILKFPTPSVCLPLRALPK